MPTERDAVAHGHVGFARLCAARVSECVASAQQWARWRVRAASCRSPSSVRKERRCLALPCVVVLSCVALSSEHDSPRRGTAAGSRALCLFNLSFASVTHANFLSPRAGKSPPGASWKRCTRFARAHPTFKGWPSSSRASPATPVSPAPMPQVAPRAALPHFASHPPRDAPQTQHPCLPAGAGSLFAGAREMTLRTEIG